MSKPRTTQTPQVVSPADPVPASTPAQTSMAADLDTFGWNASTCRTKKGAMVVLYAAATGAKLASGRAATVAEAYAAARAQAADLEIV